VTMIRLYEEDELSGSNRCTCKEKFGFLVPSFDEAFESSSMLYFHPNEVKFILLMCTRNQTN